MVAGSQKFWSMFVLVALDLPAAAFVLLKVGILVDIGRWGRLRELKFS